MSQHEHVRTALRVPPDLHRKIHEAADASGRSFNAEILNRLESSFSKGPSGPDLAFLIAHLEYEIADFVVKANRAKLTIHSLALQVQLMVQALRAEGYQGELAAELDRYSKDAARLLETDGVGGIVPDALTQLVETRDRMLSLAQGRLQHTDKDKSTKSP